MNSFEKPDYIGIIARRDRRYDGRFFFGVRTTRIYCRPICPARARPENIILFRSAAEAEQGGFRACRRCRPELAPGHLFLNGTSNTVSRALRLMEDHWAEKPDMEALAGSLGVTSRHLRRLFVEHLGASPLEVHNTHRLHFARNLLENSTLPITDVAIASGFLSIRRFNEAFKAAFQVNPTTLRSNKGLKLPASGIRLRLPVKPPYDWPGVLAYLDRHACFGLEHVENGRYHRFVSTGRKRTPFGTITVSYQHRPGHIEVCFENIPLTAIRTELQHVRRLFDVSHDPAQLSPRFRERGIRVPGSYSSFETAVSIVLSQLISTSNAKRKLRTLVETFGRPIGTNSFGPVYEFPAPSDLLTAPLERLGITSVRAGALRALSGAVNEGFIDFRAAIGFAELRERLLSIKGIGPWTASMILMRCAGDPDALPANDLVVKRALDSGQVDLSEWKGHHAYLTHFLWKESSSGNSGE